MDNKVAERKKRVENIVERGDYILTEEKQLDWFSMCYKNQYSERGLHILEETLNIMEQLEESIDNAIMYFQTKSYDYNIAMSILNTVLNYHSQGPDFVERIMGDKLSELDIAAIKEIREKNNQKKL